MLVGWSQDDSAAGLRQRCERKQLRSCFSWFVRREKISRKRREAVRVWTLTASRGVSSKWYW